MSTAFTEYYRCPGTSARFVLSGKLSAEAGPFKWGADTVCYGHPVQTASGSQSNGGLRDVLNNTSIRDSSILLPFDPQEVLENLQRERYSNHLHGAGKVSRSAVYQLYYMLRPYLNVQMRKHLQRWKLRGWKGLTFPEWPVDTTVDRIERRLMALTIRASGEQTMPFIWFWPDGHEGCTIVTHDVETVRGRDFCGRLMDMDELFGFKASFQVVPESRYPVPAEYLAQIKGRGFEVNVHDLTHDGQLFAEHKEFLRRAEKINAYGREFGACGFRSGALYRNTDWFDAFDCSYDMSVPNVGHLDPQRGGCCTVLPYFIGNIVELPLTCTQDYTLFHMLNDYSMDIWKDQIDRIVANHGLVTILVHPDYVMEARAEQAYVNLLEYLAAVRDTKNLWAPLPRDVAAWWHQRRAMTLVRDGASWRIDGPGAERARVAYAVLNGESVRYTFDPEETQGGRPATECCEIKAE